MMVDCVLEAHYVDILDLIDDGETGARASAECEAGAQASAGVMNAATWRAADASNHLYCDGSARADLPLPLRLPYHYS
ncbi:hypothetical protein J6590_046514 [Homalodisca vitripennis]|nr:hypothetical protein J6590_046514 [Homalodisca vitripennis]